MKKTVQDIMELIRQENIKMVDFKMVDINGQFRHVTIPAEDFNEELMNDGVGFDAFARLPEITAIRFAALNHGE